MKIWRFDIEQFEIFITAARANITLEDQIHQIHKVKGLLPDEEKEKIGPKPGGPNKIPPPMGPPLGE